MTKTTQEIEQFWEQFFNRTLPNLVSCDIGQWGNGSFSHLVTFTDDSWICVTTALNGDIEKVGVYSSKDQKIGEWKQL